MLWHKRVEAESCGCRRCGFALVAVMMLLAPDTALVCQVRVLVISLMWYVRERILASPLVYRPWQAVPWRKVHMVREFDGEVTGIDLPCPILIEVALSVAVEDHHLGVCRNEAEYDSGRTIRLDVDLFEKYLGDEEHSDVPIVKYSTESHAPALCNNLRLRTPNYYRTLETGSPGLGDPLEGCRVSHESPIGSQLIMTPSAEGTSIILDASGANRTDGCFKTFMYCCSLHRNNHVLTRESARDIFGQDYTHGSVFPSSKELAKHIIAAFAATVGRLMLENAEPAEGDSFARACAWIVHGPVKYFADTSPNFRTIESLFMKPNDDIYRNQNEYRFWVGFSDTPVQSDDAAIALPVPRELATAVDLKPS